MSKKKKPSGQKIHAHRIKGNIISIKGAEVKLSQCVISIDEATTIQAPGCTITVDKKKLPSNITCGDSLVISASISISTEGKIERVRKIKSVELADKIETAKKSKKSTDNDNTQIVSSNKSNTL